MRVHLTGPREGQTVKLNGVQFVNGAAEIADGAFGYFFKCYKVVQDGRSNDAPADSKGNRSNLQGEPEVRPDGVGAPQEAPIVLVRDDGGDGGTAEQHPGGYGHGHSGIHREAGDDPLGQAMTLLDPEDNALWTGTGRPKVNALASALGRMVTKEEVEERFSGGERGEAAKIKDGPTPRS